MVRGIFFLGRFKFVRYNLDIAKTVVEGDLKMLFIGIIFANVFFVNSVIIQSKIHQKDNEKSFSENLQLQILIGVISLTLALFFICVGS